MAIELNQIWDFPIKEFHPFPRALLGVGAHDILGVEAKNLGFERTLLVTTGLRGSGIIEELKGKIEYQGVEVVVYDKVESNPKDYNCMDAATHPLVQTRVHEEPATPARDGPYAHQHRP